MLHIKNIFIFFPKITFDYLNVKVKKYKNQMYKTQMNCAGVSQPSNKTMETGKRGNMTGHKRQRKLEQTNYNF